MGPPKNGFYINGRNKGDMIKHGERINYDCIGSYSLVGNSTQGCSDGQWSNPSPTCKGIYNKVNLLCYLISELNQESLFFSFFGGGGGGFKKKTKRGFDKLALSVSSQYFFYTLPATYVTIMRPELQVVSP